MGLGWGPDDKFIIIGVGHERVKAFREILELWPTAEIVAPIERRMVRPRRKSKTGEPFFIERPLFMEYVAVGRVTEWEALLRKDWCLFVLKEGERPKQLTRECLKGMLTKSMLKSWEGAVVEIVSGPMKGQRGIYRKGRVEVGLFGRQVQVKVSVFNLSMV